MVGISRRGGVPRWQKTSCFQRDYAEQGHGVYDGNGSKQERAGPGKDSRSGGCRAQQPLFRRILAAHAGRGRSDRSRARLDLQTVGSCAARHHGRGSRGPLDKCARRTNDLYRPAHQHQRKNSRRSSCDSALRQAMLRVKRVYDKPTKEDGWRVLVDRLWPRGMTKEEAKIDLSRCEQVAGISREIPCRTETEKRIARAAKENRKGARKVDASLRRERYGTQSSCSSGRSFEKRVRQK